MNLGELEKLVLKYFWQVKTADAKQVYAHFEKQRGGTLNTIQSTLDRLFKKGLLKRNKESHAFQYRAAKHRKAFIGDLVQDVTRDFTLGEEDSLLTTFVSLSNEMNEAQLEQLEKMILDYRSTISSEEKQCS